MKSKKLIAVLSAASMLGSLIVAIPASADTSENVYPSEGIHVRANGNDTTGFGQYNTLNVADTTLAAATQYEMQWASQFAAIYKYDLSAYLDETNVSVTVTLNDTAYTVVPYSSIPANDATSKVAFATFLNDNTATAATGARTSALTWSDLKTIADDNNGEVCLILTRYNSGQWKKYIDMDQTPYLTVTIAEPTEAPTAEPTAEPTEAPTAEPTEAPTAAPVVATVDGVEYADLKTALESAEDGQTVDVLQSTTLAERVLIDSDITVTTSNGSTITTANTTPGGILIKSTKNVEAEDPSVTVVFDGIDIIAGGSNPAIAVSCMSTVTGVEAPHSGVTIKDATVTGKIYHENGRNADIVLDNATVTEIYTRHSRGGNGADCGINLTNGSSVGSITYSTEHQGNYYRDSVTVDGTSSVDTLTDIAVRFYTVTGETERSYDTLKIRSAAGADAIATNSAHGVTTTPLNTVITGENVSVAIQFINIPYDVEITRLTLE